MRLDAELRQETVRSLQPHASYSSVATGRPAPKPRISILGRALVIRRGGAVEGGLVISQKA